MKWKIMLEFSILEELYNSHTDYAAEMYFRNQMIHSEAYRKFVSDFNLDISSEDWHRMIFGFSDKVEDICKRPISSSVRTSWRNLKNIRNLLKKRMLFEYF